MGPHAIDEIRTGQVDLIFGYPLRLKIEQRARVLAQQLFNAIERGRCSFEFGSHDSFLLIGGFSSPLRKNVHESAAIIA